MDEAQQEIMLGAEICEKLKAIYFIGQSWVDCHRDIAGKLSHLKLVAQKFYTEKTRIEILQEIRKYSPQDIEDALNMS